MTAKALSFLTPTVGGEMFIDVGFTPNLVMFVGGYLPDPQVTDTSITDYVSYFGIAGINPDGALQQAVTSQYAFAGGNTSTMDSQSIFSILDCLVAGKASKQILFKAKIASFNDTGFTLDFSVVDPTPRRVKCIAFQLVESFIQVMPFKSPPSTLSPDPRFDSTIGVGFQPCGCIFLSGDVEPSLSTLNAFAVGFDDGKNHICTTTDMLDGPIGSGIDNGSLGGLSAEHSIFTRSYILTHPTPGQIVGYKGSIKTFDQDGFTVKWDKSVGERFFTAICFMNCDFACLAEITGVFTWDTGFEADGIVAVNQVGGALDDEEPVAGAFSFWGAIDSDLGSSNVNASVFLDTSISSVIGRATMTEMNGYVNYWNLTTVGHVEVHIDSINPTSVSITATTGGSQSRTTNFLALKSHSTNPLGGGNGLLENDMELAPGDTHYMTFGHRNKNVISQLWTAQLFKNGQLCKSQPLNFQENPLGTYTWSFVNDGDDQAQWTLVVYETVITNTKYSMTWYVRKRIVEQTVKMMRNQMASSLIPASGDGGFIGGQNKS